VVGNVVVFVQPFLRPSFVDLGATPLASVLNERRGRAAARHRRGWGLFLGGVALLLWNFAWLVRRRERRCRSTG
jgi:hypothetical protein